MLLQIFILQVDLTQNDKSWNLQVQVSSTIDTMSGPRVCNSQTLSIKNIYIVIRLSHLINTK